MASPHRDEEQDEAQSGRVGEPVGGARVAVEGRDELQDLDGGAEEREADRESGEERAGPGEGGQCGEGGEGGDMLELVARRSGADPASARNTRP